MRIKFLLFLVLLALASSGCSRMIAGRFASSMQATMEEQNDIDQVYEGLPALLLLQESILGPHPDEKILLAAVRGESSFAELLDVYGEKQRAALHAQKGAAYACKLLDRGLSLPDSCTVPLPAFDAALAKAGNDAVPALFWGASALGTDMKMQQGAPQSLARLPRILAVMNRLLQTAPDFYHGGPLLFLGYYYGSLPVMLGGKPEESKAYFERALEITHRRFLLAQVLYAESYARQVLDRPLFEKLLHEVLDAHIDAPEVRTANALARKKAQDLLSRSDQFF